MVLEAMAIENYMIFIWLGVFVAAVVIEAATQDLLSIWFAIGALVALIISSMVDFWVEFVVFAVISIVALICTRPLVKKLMARTERKTNSDEFVGKRVKAITDITKYDGGDIKLNGIVYKAILMEDSDITIEKDSIVEVVALKGNRAVVRVLENKEGNVDVFGE